MKKTLLIVDVQNDFIEGGSLGVTGGKAVAENVATLLNSDHGYELIVVTQDWHIDPGSHWSDEPDFNDSWPVHCKAGTAGAELHPALAEALKGVTVPVYNVRKGQYEAAYSGFEGTYAVDDKTTLSEILLGEEVETVDVVGIATDHCVLQTVLDALRDGLQVDLLTELIAGVDATRSTEALSEMAARGAVLV